MRLTEIPLVIPQTELPADVAAFLEDAGRRVAKHTERLPSLVSGFVPSDFAAVYRALSFIRDQHLACGNSFCEWGSGLGVIASLAAMLRFDAYGIEIDRELCEASRQLAADYDISVVFVHGSYVPAGADRIVDRAFLVHDGGLSLNTQTDRTYDDLGLEVRDFDIIFTYPWPDDEALIARLFHRFAARGALLLTYHDSKPMRLRRK